MGININGINRANIILIAINITYSVLLWIPLPNVLSVPLVSNLTWIKKSGAFWWEVFDWVSVNATAQGLVIIQIWNGYHTRGNLVTWVPVKLQQ